MGVRIVNLVEVALHELVQIPAKDALVPPSQNCILECSRTHPAVIQEALEDLSKLVGFGELPFTTHKRR
jgi:hypothetical protein